MVPYDIYINVLRIQGHANNIPTYFSPAIFGMCILQRDVDQYRVTTFKNIRVHYGSFALKFIFYMVETFIYTKVFRQGHSKWYIVLM